MSGFDEGGAPQCESSAVKRCSRSRARRMTTVMKVSDNIKCYRKLERYLKIVPRKKVDLTRFFDSADLGMNIEDWDEFERRFYEQ